MESQKIEIEHRFYQRCAELLSTTHAYKPWVGRPPNRWNNRHPGNGRYPGFGTIRMYAPNLIQVSLREPVLINRTCRSPEEVYALIERVLQ